MKKGIVLAIAALAAGHALGRWKQRQDRPVRWIAFEVDPAMARLGGWHNIFRRKIIESAGIPERFLRPPMRPPSAAVKYLNPGIDIE